jgi:TonB-linked SusC/RagA family outer membrane protein
MKKRGNRKIQIRFLLLLFALATVETTFAQILKVQGTIVDTKGEPVIGASIVVTGTARGTVTDASGKFFLDATAKESLTVSYIGYEKTEVAIGNQTDLRIVLKENQEMLDEVVVVAFGSQKKESMVSSITTINAKELKVPSSNLTTALAGRLSGVIAYQRSGEPGRDNADFFIRGVTTFGYKKDPLILIDGIETTSTELARLTPDDIEAFSILKDATATALYGARGANGVIQIKTKEGKEGPAKVQVRLENRFSSNTRNVELADPVTFMVLNNEARNTRAPLGLTDSRYSQEKIDQTRRGANPLMYPANNWRELLTRPTVSNQAANLSISGGGGIARYYIAASFAKDNGNLKVDKLNNFNNNIDLRSYTLRSNINIDVTKTTTGTIRLAGTFDDYTGPIDGGETMYKKTVQANPVEFPAYYPADLSPFTNHILFGNAPRGNTNAGYMNPYADLMRGYKEYSKSLIDAALEVNQNFDFVTKGLKGRILFNTSRYSYFDVTRAYNPYYYGVNEYDRMTDDVLSIKHINTDGSFSEWLNYAPGGSDVNSTIYVEGALTYNQKFNEVHEVNGLLVYYNRQQLYSNKADLMLSLPYRNQGLSGRFTYGFDSRYLLELNFGYNGSERFHKTERFGFFPAIGLGYVVSNEKFWEKLTPVIPKFKLKGTYGLVGNDAIGDENDRFFYLSKMNMDDGGRGYAFGFVNNNPYSRNGFSITRYENKDISWEKSYKTNLGIEFNLFNTLEFQADYFTEHRTNILMERSFIPSSMGVSAPIKANVGEAKANGVDASVDYNKYFSSGYWLQGRANFTYSHSEFMVYEEPEYKESYRSRVGQSLNQRWGLIAERLFVDEYEVINSPRQTFGEYGAGDIKYHDVNGDGLITDADAVPIGFPTTPEIIYGFGLSGGNKSFDFSFFFQGSARSSFWIDAENTAPFRHIDAGGDFPFVRDVPLLKDYADSYWSENNRNLYAVWPRLSEQLIQNNIRTSTWFMRDGSFLRLKTVELGYSLTEKLLTKLRLKNARIYLSGNNLLLFSKFKMWDVEMGGNGLGYPIQRVYNIGLQIGF